MPCPLEYIMKIWTAVEPPILLNAVDRIFNAAEIREIIHIVAAG